MRFAVFPIPSRSDEDGNQSLVELERHNRRKQRSHDGNHGEKKASTHWTGAEPFNELYSLCAFSLLNLGPHSETTGAVNTTNQTVSTRTGGEVTGPGGVVVVRSV